MDLPIILLIKALKKTIKRDNTQGIHLKSLYRLISEIFSRNGLQPIPQNMFGGFVQMYCELTDLKCEKSSANRNIVLSGIAFSSLNIQVLAQTLEMGRRNTAEYEKKVNDLFFGEELDSLIVG